MLRRPRSGRLEAWAATWDPSFETHRFAMLLKMRQKEGARSATKQSPPPGCGLDQVQAPMAPGQNRVLAKRTRGLRRSNGCNGLWPTRPNTTRPAIRCCRRAFSVTFGPRRAQNSAQRGGEDDAPHQPFGSFVRQDFGVGIVAENLQNDRKIRVLSSFQSRRLRAVGTKVLCWRLRLPGLRDCRRKGMPPANNHRRSIMGSGP